MKKNILKTVLLLSVFFFTFSCLNKNNIDYIVATEWDKCKGNTNCIIDFATSMNFEWDTIYYFSGANSLEDINKILGFKLKEFTDVGDRLIFLNNGRVVYQKEWFYNPSKPPEGVVIMTDLKNLMISKSDAKFEIKKAGKAFYLTKI